MEEISNHIKVKNLAKTVLGLNKTELASVCVCKCGRNLRCEDYIGHYIGLVRFMELYPTLSEKEKGVLRTFLFDNMHIIECCRMHLMCYYDQFELL